MTTQTNNRNADTIALWDAAHTDTDGALRAGPFRDHNGNESLRAFVEEDGRIEVTDLDGNIVATGAIQSDDSDKDIDFQAVLSFDTPIDGYDQTYSMYGWDNAIRKANPDAPINLRPKRKPQQGIRRRRPDPVQTQPEMDDDLPF